MNRLIKLLTFFVGLSASLYAQNDLGKTDDLGRIALVAVIPEQAENIPVSAHQLLMNKMIQVAVQNGLSATGANPRFCIVPLVNVLSKEVTPSAPPLMVLNLDVTFLIVDAESRIIFSQSTVSIKGVGQSIDKSYIDGIKKINVKSGQFKGFVETGKSKILEYYNSQCDAIQKKALALSDQKKFEEALFTLMNVPDVCQECYDKCMLMSASIYQKYIDTKGNEYLSGAKAAWAGMNVDKAIACLSNITPEMTCYNAASELSNTIMNKMAADGASAWAFKMKKYDDAELRERLILEAKRDVAISWANAYYRSATPQYQYVWNWLYRK